jgi:hypothetical protein
VPRRAASAVHAGAALSRWLPAAPTKYSWLNEKKRDQILDARCRNSCITGLFIFAPRPRASNVACRYGFKIYDSSSAIASQSSKSLQYNRLQLIPFFPIATETASDLRRIGPVNCCVAPRKHFNRLPKPRKCLAWAIPYIPLLSSRHTAFCERFPDSRLRAET